MVDPGFDAPETTAVYKEGDKFKCIKGYRLVKKNETADTTIQIAKGSGVAVGDVLAYGKKGVACTEIDTTNESYDVVTVTMGVAIPVGAVLYQAKSAGSSAQPIGTPVYVTGNKVFGGKGDQPTRLINGANLREVTANIGSDIAAILPTINLV